MVTSARKQTKAADRTGTLEQMEKGDDERAEISVKMSPTCANVLLSGGVLDGAGLAYVVAPATLCTAGLCAVGISGASSASW